ncbi:MAG: hypothetical protein N4A33_00505 [Bacteriovoracaceae bacterium]|jgi:hypothetical protein|nr:hypothetical protein [Bacteriovoracaceae bacterium]
MKTILFIIITITSAFANSITFEIGQTQTNFNFFQIPNNNTNRISLPDKKVTSYRLSSWLKLNNTNKLYFLIAPFQKEYNFTSTSNFSFDGINFSSNQKTNVIYKFNSYRIGYYWFKNISKFKYWYGGLLKIRDALIEVKQARTTKSYDNIGLVPLLSFGFEWALNSWLRLYSHTDALSSSKGSAYDSGLEFRAYNFGLGKRVLGGGVDNDKLKNFTQFDTYYLNYTFLF